MLSIWNDIKEKFNPFITLPIFLLGIVLLLLGITTGVNIPTQGINLISEPSFRAVSIILGIICIVLCLVLNLVHKKPIESSDMADEFKRSLLNRAANLSSGQNDILRYIRQKTENPSSNLLSDTEFNEHFDPNRSRESELYYRLEQLRLLGLITRTAMGQTTYFRLSDSYRKALAASSSSRRE
jgi:hypothetical protein